MRFFTVLDFQYWVLAFFLGLTALVFVCVAWGTYPRRYERGTREDAGKPAGPEVQTAHDMDKNPIPPILILAYTFIALWALGYMFFIGIKGTGI